MLIDLTQEKLVIVESDTDDSTETKLKRSAQSSQQPRKSIKSSVSTFPGNASRLHPIPITVLDDDEVIPLNKYQPDTTLLSKCVKITPKPPPYTPACLVEQDENDRKNALLKDLLNPTITTAASESDSLSICRHMSVTLLDHQKEGLSWMLKAENIASKNGGILADDMGLGKTIQMLALIHNNPSTDSKRHATLVVCPVSLLNQWSLEIETKSSIHHRPCVFIYHRQSFKEIEAKKFSKFDIVITSYGTLLNEYRNHSKGIKDSHLFDTEWWRVVLDEAHCLKNPQTITSEAVCGLKASKRWCLTGTPIQNGIKDFFPLLRFLKIKVTTFMTSL